MPADPDAPTPQRRPHPQALAAPFLEFDLARELNELHHESQPSSGQNAKTLVKHEDLRIVLIALEAQAKIMPHQTKGRLTIQALDGRVRLRALGRTFDLTSGSLLALDQGVGHEVEALEDSAILLTIAWPGGSGDEPPKSP